MQWTGADGSLWRRMVPFGVESWSRPRKWAVERDKEREVWRVFVTPPGLDRVWMWSWYSAGYGWLAVKMDVEVAAEVIDPRTNGFA